MFATPAFAQTAGSPAAAGGFEVFQTFVPLLLVFIAFYFLMIRPQQGRMKQLQNAIAALKKVDEVTTAGGLIGKVTKVDDKVVELEIAQGVRVKVIKSTLAAVAVSGAKPAND